MATPGVHARRDSNTGTPVLSCIAVDSSPQSTRPCGSAEIASRVHGKDTPRPLVEWDLKQQLSNMLLYASAIYSMTMGLRLGSNPSSGEVQRLWMFQTNQDVAPGCSADASKPS